MGETPSPGYARRLYMLLGNRHKELQQESGEDEMVMMRYDSPAGESIFVDVVYLDEYADALLFVGKDFADNPCTVIAPVQSAHIILKILPLPELPPERRTIEFKTR